MTLTGIYTLERRHPYVIAKMYEDSLPDSDNGLMAIAETHIKLLLETPGNAHKALVRSILEYGSTIWDPYLQKDINKIEKI